MTIDDFKGGFGKTKSGNAFIILKFAKQGLRANFKDTPTKEDMQEVNDIIAKCLDVEVTSKFYDREIKDMRGEELTDYNKFIRDKL